MLKILKIDESQYRYIYIISDIHGEGNLLDELLEKIEYDKKDLFIILGDSFDRGAAVEKVLKLFLKLEKNSNLIHLIGNHEKMLEDYLMFGEKYPYFYKDNGSKTTVEFLKKSEENKDYILDFIDRMYHIVEGKNNIFVHAGIDLKKKIEDQEEEYILWTKDDFWQYNSKKNKKIFFGHIIQEYGVIKDYGDYNCIGMDCGAYKFKRLGCYEVKSKKTVYTGGNSYGK